MFVVHYPCKVQNLNVNELIDFFFFFGCNLCEYDQMEQIQNFTFSWSRCKISLASMEMLQMSTNC